MHGHWRRPAAVWFEAATELVYWALVVIQDSARPRRRSGWLVAWIVLFGLILSALVAGAYFTSGTEAALQMVVVGGIYIALPLSFFVLLVVWTFVAVPIRQLRAERRNRVSNGTALIESGGNLRRLPDQQFTDYRRQIPPRTTRS